MYCSENDFKGHKVNPYLYILQEIEAKCFLRLNEKGPNEDNR